MKAEQDTRTGAELETVEQVETLTPDKIYNNQIELYIDSLIDAEYTGLTPADLKKERAFFPRLIQYLYDNYIGDLLDNRPHTGKKIVYPDISLLDNLFSIYKELVYKYKFNSRPALLEFCIFTGIARDTIYNWLKGDTNSYIYNNNGLVDNNNSDIASEDKRRHITPDYSDTVKKWQMICEQSLVDGSGDTIKEIFLLKSKHGYREADKDITITVNNKPLISADVLPSLVDLKSNN